jgi:predicted nucleic acid-binding protein
VIAYLDSSVVLRVVLAEPQRLAEWGRISSPVSSAITEVECLRTLDRGLAHGRLDTTTVAERRAAVYDVLRRTEIVSLSPPVLARAGASFPTPLGTLDALHLATALLWRERSDADAELQFATHDAGLAVAARACGLQVIGV